MKAIFLSMLAAGVLALVGCSANVDPPSELVQQGAQEPTQPVQISESRAEMKLLFLNGIRLMDSEFYASVDGETLFSLGEQACEMIDSSGDVRSFVNFVSKNPERAETLTVAAVGAICPEHVDLLGDLY